MEKLEQVGQQASTFVHTFHTLDVIAKACMHFLWNEHEPDAKVKSRLVVCPSQMYWQVSF